MAAQQPAAPRNRIPVPAVPAFYENIGDQHRDFRKWLIRFNAYLFCIEYNQDPGQPLGDRGRVALLLSHLGNEGRSSFSATPGYMDRANLTFAALCDQVPAHFRCMHSVFKARFDFYSRRQGRGEPIKEFIGALRVLAVDCQFGAIGSNANIEDHLKTQLVCHNLDQWARMELFSRRQAMTLQDVLDILMASEAAGQDVSGIACSGSQPAV
ncbi:MAG: hypothetical protein GY696_23675, partial [Gammaproteobacteria bacterium]|nr:hypothetical protein [Gammaproteobacteria bacterium]